MALGSLLVAAAAVWFIKFNVPQTPVTNSAEIQKLVNDLGEKTTAHAAQLEQIKQLESRIASLESGAVKTAGGESRITDHLPADPPGDVPSEDEGDDGDKFDEYFSANASDGDSVDGDTPSTDATADADDDVEADENGLKLGAMSDDSDDQEEDSILRVVQTSLRPNNDEYSVTMTLRNTSEDTPAVISKVLFSPKEVVEDVPTSLAVKPLGKSTDTEFVMAFGAEHNQSRGSGRKGQYVKLLIDRYTVDPGKEITVRMGIKDPEHIGFGLLGSLELEFNTTESLKVPSLALAFLGEEN